MLKTGRLHITLVLYRQTAKASHKALALLSLTCIPLHA